MDGGGHSGRLAVCVGALALVAVAFPAPVVSQTVIGFDDLAAGTVVTNQYDIQGIDFVASLSSRRVIRSVGAAEAESGDQVLDMSINDATAPSLQANLSSPQSSISLAAGQLDPMSMGDQLIAGCAVTLTAYDGNHVDVGDATALLPSTLGDGIHTRLSVTSSGQVITSFVVSVSPPIMCANARTGVDDIRLGPVDANVTVQISGPGSVSGNGIVCPAACMASYVPGTALRLSAVPSPGSVFAGWGGACSSAVLQPICSLTTGTNATTVGATFRAPILTVLRSGTGGGVVDGVPPGISCGAACAAEFRGGTQIVLTANPDGTSVFSGWAGACADSIRQTCTLTLDGDRTAEARFTSRPLLDTGAKPESPLLPKPVKSLAVDVDGSGSVTTLNPANAVFTASLSSALAPSARLAQIRCGITGFVCFATVKPGTRVGLVARPGPGQIFQGWGGACTGTTPTCTTTLGANGTVSARFASRSGRALVATLQSPQFRVHWKQSSGAGALVVSGRVSRPSVLRLQLRRPFGGPLLTETLSTGAGAFTHTTVLRPGILLHGARLFPGGFIVSLQGRSGSTALPPELQTVALPAPAQGVVRHAYLTTTSSGAAARSAPAGSKGVWAHFVFQSQPRGDLPLSVSWRWPDGRLLGTVRKANRPEVVTWMQAPVALPTGDWRVELRAGHTLVSVLNVRIG